MNYELDSYLDALKKFPNSEIKLHTEKGTAFHIKTDVFKQQMWYLQEERKEDVTTTSMVPLSPEIVKEIIEMNKAGKKPADLKAYLTEVEVEEPDYTNVVGQDSLNRFDNTFKKKKKKKKKSKNQTQGQQQQGQQQKPQGQGNQQAKQAQPNKGQQNKPQQVKKDQTKQPAQKQGGGNQPQNKKQPNQNLPKKGNDQNPNQQKKGNDQNRNRNNNNRNNRPKQGGNSGNTENNAKKDQ